jgi:hypothetical protein
LRNASDKPFAYALLPISRGPVQAADDPRTLRSKILRFRRELPITNEFERALDKHGTLKVAGPKGFRRAFAKPLAERGLCEAQCITLSPAARTDQFCGATIDHDAT